jgi:2-polyprenyl-3-methyl-5-hydroxy-6-metoxy-1,4-benzoquinol methylase
MPGAAQYMPGPEDLATERGADLVICQCAACGLVQIDAEPVPYYREVVRAAAFSPEMRGFRLDQFRAFAEGHGLAGRKVLEIGCGRGEYLSVLAEAGFEAHGLEYAQTAVQHCRADGLTAHQGFIDGPTVSVGAPPYDGFLILNFLEHLPQPVATLRGIAHNLADGAVGLVEVPNFDMIVEKQLFSEFIGDHLCYFTAATLAQTLSQSGFDLLSCEPVWHGYILSATVRKRRPADLSVLTRAHDKIGADVAAFLAKAGARGGNASRGAAIWGAGHQALAVISLLDLAGSVRYVVDSAPFKQGRYTPASHLPIVAPSALRDDPVDAVLVMAASYSDEVAGLLRRDYDPDLALGILRDWGVEQR